MRNSNSVIRLRIKDVAKEKGISMNKLSRLADVSLNTVAKIFRDPYYNIAAHTIDKIARALDVPLSELMIQEDEPSTSQEGGE